MTQAPRIVHLVPALFGPKGVVGGAERYALELARHMAEQVPTTLVSFGDEAREETMGALRIRVVDRAHAVRGNRLNPVSLKAVPELWRADIIHCHQRAVLSSSLAALFARATGKKAFTTDLGGGGWDFSAYVNTDRWFHGHLHLSEYSRQVHGHEGKPWAHVIYGGVDTERFSPDASVARDGSVVFVGRLLPHKGVADLIDALPDGMRLELYGPPMNEAYLATLKQLSQDKQVTFHHGAPDAELVQAYRRALCVVLPSVYTTRDGATTKVPELLGQTPLEGMACETPAVVTDVASLPEVVADGETGFVAKPNDPPSLAEKLRWLRDHPKEARQMGEAGRRRVLSRFTWAAVVERCLEIYGVAR